ncbi:MAG: alpha/beta hydrolase [Acetobacteraceae bacterium]|nr:alpha/beta hydrolase [Acetobacteraceae bacterium]
MLGFRWLAAYAGAPKDDGYAAAIDRLVAIDRTGLQDFVRGAPPLAPPNVALQQAVDGWLGGRGLRRVVVMVHGFQFDVSALNAEDASATTPADDPFNRVYAAPGHELAPVRPESWLPIAGETDEAGTLLSDCTIGFGWDSDYSFIGESAGLENGFQYALLDVAPLAARALATLIATLQNKGLAVEVIAHSMGTRTACQALRLLADGGLTHLVSQILLIEGSEFSVDAYDAATRLPNTQFYNVGNQHDTWPPLGAKEAHPFRFNGTLAAQVVGYQGIAPLANVADIQIDRRDLRDWAATQGYALQAGPVTVNGVTRAEHWAAYIHADNRRFLRDMLVRPDRSVAWLRDTRAPLGFTYAGYGLLAGVAIPPMPQSREERLAAQLQPMQPQG